MHLLSESESVFIFIPSVDFVAIIVANFNHMMENNINLDKFSGINCSCGSVVEHCVSNAKVVGSIPRVHTK